MFTSKSKIYVKNWVGGADLSMYTMGGSVNVGARTVPLDRMTVWTCGGPLNLDGEFDKSPTVISTQGGKVTHDSHWKHT